MKVVVIGGPRVGKTSLMCRLSSKPLSKRYIATRAEHNALTISCGDCLLSVSDLPGESIGTFNEIGTFCRDYSFSHSNFCEEISTCDIAVFVLDISSRDSMRYTDEWVEAVCSLAPKARRILLANKADLISQSVIKKREITDFCDNMCISDWSYTVSHSALGDVVPNRAPQWRQRPLEDMLASSVHAVQSSWGTQQLYPIFRYMDNLQAAPVLQFIEWTTILDPQSKTKAEEKER